MTKTVWKYELSVQDRTIINLPRHSQILTVQVQNERPCVWVLVNPDEITERVEFSIYGTGNPIQNDHGTYVGTFQMMEGKLVLHLFIKTLDQND